MIDLNVIDKEILELEAKDTTYTVMERLAWLYIVRDRNKKQSFPQIENATNLSAMLNNTKDINKFIEVLDEHIQGLSIVNPRCYQRLMAKLETI